MEGMTPMHVAIRCSLVALGLPILLANVRAQVVDDSDRPRPHIPIRQPTKKEADELEALHWFARGAICERDDRLVEAMQCYESAARLDPEAVTIQKALLMIYLAMERPEDAAALMKKVLDLDPHDHETSYLYARVLRNRGHLEEACAVLKSGMQSKSLRDRSDLHQQMEFDLGVNLERLEKYEQAAAAFGRAAAILDRPDSLLEGQLGPEEIQMRSADLHERAGRNFLEARDFDKATAAFHAAQGKYPPGAGRLDFNLAQVCLQQGKLNEAAAALQNYLQLMPQGTQAYELMIGLMHKQKRQAEVVPWLEQCAGKDRFNVGLHLLLARQYIHAGDLGKADKIYTELAETGPTEQVYRDLFVLYKDHRPQGVLAVAEIINNAFQFTQPDGATPARPAAAAQSRAMLGALRDNPDLARPVLHAAADLAQQKPLSIDALQVFATYADRLGMFAEAEVFYRQCIKQPLPAATEPLIYGSMLQLLWKARNFDALVEACRTGLKQARASNRVLLRAELARALGQLERWNEALTEIDQAVREAGDGEAFLVKTLRVRLLIQASKVAAAEADCKNLLEERKLPGEVLELHYLLATVYSAGNRLGDAEAELVHCLKIDPDNAAVNNDLGYQWADQNKNLDQAEAMIRKAVEQDRKNRQSFVPPRPGADKEFHDNACYIDSLGWVLFRRGQPLAACKELEYATTLPDGDDPVIWDHLGDVYLALGNRDGAISAWQQAIHFYEEAKHRKMDERYKTLQQKLKALIGGR
jgi:tetratricopeptide (TPR) repeat protein